MARLKLLASCLALALALPGVGLADPWKDESGRGRGDRRGDYRSERWDDRRYRDRRDWSDRRGDYRGGRWDDRGYFPPRHAQPRIPPGHLPPPGEYRAWFPDRPPGHQPPPQRWR